MQSGDWFSFDAPCFADLSQFTPLPSVLEKSKPALDLEYELDMDPRNIDEIWFTYPHRLHEKGVENSPSMQKSIKRISRMQRPAALTNRVA